MIHRTAFLECSTPLLTGSNGLTRNRKVSALRIVARIIIRFYAKLPWPLFTSMCDLHRVIVRCQLM